MFVQVIKGRTNDAAGLRRQLDVWRDEVQPGAIGFVGSTAGVAEDGTCIAFVRFADEASAKANADRPEQSAWWEATAGCFDGAPTFRESSDVTLLWEGGSDRAGFVQVMEGRVSDRARADAFETPEMLEQLRMQRPDLMGGMRVWFDGGEFAEAAYFTSEEEARKGEASMDMPGPADEYMALYGDMSYIDLKDPLFA